MEDFLKCSKFQEDNSVCQKLPTSLEMKAASCARCFLAKLVFHVTICKVNITPQLRQDFLAMATKDYFRNTFSLTTVMKSGLLNSSIPHYVIFYRSFFKF